MATATPYSPLQVGARIRGSEGTVVEFVAAVQRELSAAAPHLRVHISWALEAPGFAGAPASADQQPGHAAGRCSSRAQQQEQAQAHLVQLGQEKQGHLEKGPAAAWPATGAAAREGSGEKESVAAAAAPCASTTTSTATATTTAQASVGGAPATPASSKTLRNRKKKAAKKAKKQQGAGMGTPSQGRLASGAAASACGEGLQGQAEEEGEQEEEAAPGPVFELGESKEAAAAEGANNTPHRHAGQPEGGPLMMQPQQQQGEPGCTAGEEGQQQDRWWVVDVVPASACMERALRFACTHLLGLEPVRGGYAEGGFGRVLE